jgi:hypothetical protein
MRLMKYFFQRGLYAAARGPAQPAWLGNSTSDLPDAAPRSTDYTHSTKGNGEIAYVSFALASVDTFLRKIVRRRFDRIVGMYRRFPVLWIAPRPTTDLLRDPLNAIARFRG